MPAHTRHVTMAGLRALLVLAILATWSCGGGGGDVIDPPTDNARHLARSGGDGQTAAAGQAVAVAPAVRVTNDAGSGVAGVTVTFSVSAGGGSLTGATAITNASGEASVGSWILGTATGANELVAQVTGGSPASVSFSATAVAGPAAMLVKVGGDGLGANKGAPVAPAPSVRVTDQFTNPVGGATVTFAVASGGGTLTGAVQVTAADGLATVGSWTLGSVGSNTLTATVNGATFAGNPATFTATGAELLFSPGTDTSVSGTIAVTRFVVPAGRTVTVTGPLDVVADSSVQVDGTLTGACVRVSIRAGHTATIVGTIRNACAVASATAPSLLIAGRAGYTVNGGTIESSGSITFTTDTAVTSATLARVSRGTTARAALAAGGTVCSFQHALARVVPPTALAGAAGQVGAPGAPGKDVFAKCEGDLVFLGGVQLNAQRGGNGGAGNSGGLTPASATGGAGGAGGHVDLRADGIMSFSGTANIFQAGDGGRGGDATATAVPNPANIDADATGGPGGDAGSINLVDATSFVFTDPTSLVLGRAGDGGDAIAVAADGQVSAGVPQPGGNASAVGGIGGSVDMAAIEVTKLVNPVNAQIGGGRAGDGGEADANGGQGSNGTEAALDGADGGNVNANGGVGGGSLTTSGNGGSATFRGGRGGNGFATCTPSLGLVLGGYGGKGGDAFGGGGVGGLGAIHGGALANNVGNGGLGAMGQPAGLHGQQGTDGIVTPGVRVNQGTNFTKSFALLLPCFSPDLLRSDSEVMHDPNSMGPPWPACSPPSFQGQFEIRNWSNIPIDVQLIWNGPPSMTFTGGNGALLPGGVATQMVVNEYWDCTDASDWESSLTVLGTYGATSYGFTIPFTLKIKNP